MSLRKLWPTTKKEEKTSENKVSLEKQNNKTLGWRDIISRLKTLYKSKTGKVKLKSIERQWKPLITQLNKIVLEVKEKHKELQLPVTPDQPKSEDPIKQFLDIAEKLINRAKDISDSISYEVYFVANKEEAQKIKTDYAIIMYVGKNSKNNETDQYHYRFVAKKHNAKDSEKLEIDDNVAPPELISLCTSSHKENNNELITTENNIDIIDSVTKKISLTHGIKVPEKSLKEILSGGLKLAEDIPVILDAFEQLPLVPLLLDRLNKFKSDNNDFNLSHFLKTVLPIETFKKLKEDAFNALKPENFKSLHPDIQVTALSAMEAYNAAIKKAALYMDEFEIKNGLIPGSLFTKINIIDNKPLSELLNEFNEKYKDAMKAANFIEPAELYPYHFSILQQRKAMLAALPTGEPESAAVKIQRKRIQDQIDKLGDVQEPPKREDIKDLYKNLQKMFEKNYEKLNELTRQVSADKKQIKQKNKNEHQLADMIIEAELFVSNMENKLKEILDEKTYEIYFTTETQADEKSPWIQQAANALQQTKNIIANIKILQQKIEAPDANTPFAHLRIKANVASELLLAGTELAIALKQLQGNVHLQESVSSEMSSAKSKISELKNNVKSNKNKTSSFLANLKESSVPLLVAIDKIKVILSDKFSNSKVNNEKIQTALNKTSILTHELKKICEGIYTKEKETSSVTFALSHIREIYNSISSLPDILSVLSEISKDDAKETAIDINSVIKDVVLYADKLEIFLCLKEGYLTNMLEPAILSYYNKLNEQGYNFHANDRYPFLLDVDKQRKTLLEDNDTPDFQKTIIKERTTSNIHRTQPHSGQSEEAITSYIKKEIFLALSSHIKTLTALLMFNNSSKNDELRTKIQLFAQFQELYNQSKFSKNLDEIFRQLKVQFPNDYHMLFEGDTGNVLKNIELNNMLPTAISKTIDLELATLKKQRGSYFFFASEQALLLEKRINACEKLQLLIKNHNLNDALSKLGIAAELLKKYDSQFIDQLKLIESALPMAQRPQTTLGNTPQEKKHAPVTLSDNSKEHQYAIELLDGKLKELNSAYQSTTVTAKIELLSELKIQLTNKHSLESAIHHIKTDKRFSNNAHLLFEGRTGKILKEAQNITITKAELFHRFDAEINILKNERYTHFRVFAHTRKNKNEMHIEALLNLRAKFTDPDKSVRDIIRDLDPTDKDVLQKYEPDLLNAFKSAPVIKRR